MRSRELAVVAIIKDEGPVIYEWLAHHAAIGVQHFYLYDNGSTDHTRAEIAAFPERRKVTVIDWPIPFGQMQAYRDAIKRFGPKWRWMAFIDADEFFVLPQGGDMRSLLQDYRAYDGLAVPWQLFGSSGHDRRPPGLVIENYTRRSEDSFIVRRHVKCIMRPERIAHTSTHPHMFFTKGGEVVREDGVAMDQAGAAIADDWVPERLRLHHYVVQSREDYEAKVRRGLATFADPREERFFTIHDRNEVEDTTAFRHAAAIRAYQARRGETWRGRLQRWLGRR